MAIDNSSKPALDIIQVSLREFLERLVDERGERFDAALVALGKLVEERDRLYISKFDASQRAVDAALTAQKEATATNFLASEKAIVKAEAAQADYNVRSNEFRGQLDDQAKTLMPRMETMGLFKGVDDRFRAFDDKVDSLRANIDNKLEVMRIAFDKAIDSQVKEIASLRESRSEGSGRNSQSGEERTQKHWTMNTTVSVLAILISLVALVFMALGHK